MRLFLFAVDPVLEIVGVKHDPIPKLDEWDFFIAGVLVNCTALQIQHLCNFLNCK